MPSSNSFMLVVLAGAFWIGFRVDTAEGNGLQNVRRINCSGICSEDDLQCNDTGGHVTCRNTCNATLFNCSACVTAWEMIYYNDTGEARFLHLSSDCFRQVSPGPTVDRCVHSSSPIQFTDPVTKAVRTIYSCQCHENRCNREIKIDRGDQNVPATTTALTVPTVTSSLFNGVPTRSTWATTLSINISTVPSLMTTYISGALKTIVPSRIVQSTAKPSMAPILKSTHRPPTFTQSPSPQPTSVYNYATPTPIFTESRSSDSSSHMEMALIIGILVPVVTLLALAVVVFMVRRLRRYERSQRKKKNEVQRLNSIHSFVTDSGLGSGSSTCNIDFQELHLQNVLKCGRFGVVWKAKFRGEDVAVKIFQEAQRTTWSTEKDFLQDPSIAHDNIVQFIAADTKDIGDGREHWLVMTYYECGNLSDYLKASILAWNDMVSLSQCLVSAVAYLHSESDTDGVRKTSVAHRDIKSANILVQNGHSCLLADFGMAIRLREDISMKELANTGQCGTARYMAPEALDCRVNLEDLNSFKQMDVYAMGLVLWEIANRCNHTGVRKYSLPYQEEVGQKPSIANMRSVVLVRKRRPLIPQEWRNDRGMNIMAETIEECWDEDSEARLPAHCVERRFQEILMPLYTIGNKTQSRLSLASLNSIAPKSNGCIYLPESAETDSGDSLPLSPNEDLDNIEDNRQGLNLSPTNEGHIQEGDSGTALEEINVYSDEDRTQTNPGNEYYQETRGNGQVVVDLSSGIVLCNTMARDDDEE